MIKNFFSFAIIASVPVMFFSCAKDRAKTDTTFTDAKFFALIKDTAQVHYYKDASGNSQFTSATFHQSRPYQLRMNDKANNACSASGKLPVGGTFPDSSLLVKELKNSGSGLLEEYSALYKLNGKWNWARYKAGNSFGSSTKIFSISDDAISNCVSCHPASSAGWSRDYVNTFDSHP